MKLRRVVVTGIGALTPLGNNVPDFWRALLNGESGAGFISRFDTSKFKTHFACEIKGFNVLDHIAPKEARRMDPSCHYAIVASEEALKDSGLNLAEIDLSKAGIIYGAAAGGFSSACEAVKQYITSDYTPRFNPFLLPMVLSDSITGNMAIRFGFRGPNYLTSSACSSGGNAIIDAMNYIRLGKANVFVCGGTEYAILPVTLGGFEAMRALSSRNDEPQKASRPFDVERDGFVLGEGAATLILEELDHALARKAKIYAEIVGAGMTCDGNHITAPRTDGDGARKAMQEALLDAGMLPEEVDYINAHGTSTSLGDASECFAIKSLFGDHAERMLISSTKSMTGHLLGAAAAIESIVSILAINHSVAPPTINLNNLDPALPKWNFCANKAVHRPIRSAISNSFGFGGHNISILFKEFHE